MRHAIAKTIAGAGLLALLARPAAAGSWGNVQPAYDAKDRHATVRVEGGADLSDKVNVYGFADLDATGEKPFDLTGVYAEGRIARSLGDVSRKLKDVSAAVEYNGGTGGGGTMRLGAIYKPDLGEGQTLIVKAFPVGTNGAGPQASVFRQGRISQAWSGSVLVDYNVKPGTLYSELELDRKVGNGIEAFAQVRLSTGHGAGSPTPIIGIKYGR